MENQPNLPPADDQAAEAHQGTPHYGDFGHPADPNLPREAAHNDGANDNPDEFCEFRGKNAAATEHYCMPEVVADPAHQRGHVEQNQNPAAVRAAADGTPGEQKAAYALDDPRMAGGDVYDLNDQQTGL